MPPISRNTAASRPITTFRAWSARSRGTESGTETTWAPSASFRVQPKPLFGPYFSTSVFGAASGVVWQRRHAGLLILIGRAMNSERPEGVSRSPTNSVFSGELRNCAITSASHSTARSRGLVGFSIAGL